MLQSAEKTPIYRKNHKYLAQRSSKINLTSLNEVSSMNDDDDDEDEEED